MNRRREIRQPIRLRVVYRDAKALVSEYTRSVSRGGCTIAAPRAIPVGTVFLFILSIEDSIKCVEVEGRIVHATPRSEGGFDLGVQYVNSSTPRKIATTRFLDQVFAEKLAKREHARVPVNLVADDLDDPSLKYLIRDLSRGGFAARLPKGWGIPPTLSKGAKAELIVYLDGEHPFIMPAAVVRMEQATAEQEQAAIAFRFEPLTDANQRLVEALLYLHRPRGIFIRMM